MNKYNKEHYSDPTPHDAMKNIAREERAAAMEPIHIVIFGEPVAQGRPRFSRHAGYVSTYDPGKSRKYKQRIFDEIWAQIATRKIRQIPPGVPLHVTVMVYRGIPKSWPKSKRDRAILGTIRPTSRPDTDNYIKIAMDGLNKALFKDDSYVVSIRAEKHYSDTPRMEIIVSQLTLGDVDHA